jgi:hypothetical protein
LRPQNAARFSSLSVAATLPWLIDGEMNGRAILRLSAPEVNVLRPVLRCDWRDLAAACRSGFHRRFLISKASRLTLFAQ